MLPPSYLVPLPRCKFFFHLPFRISTLFARAAPLFLSSSSSSSWKKLMVASGNDGNKFRFASRKGHFELCKREFFRASTEAKCTSLEFSRSRKRLLLYILYTRISDKNVSRFSTSGESYSAYCSRYHSNFNSRVNCTEISASFQK